MCRDLVSSLFLRRLGRKCFSKRSSQRCNMSASRAGTNDQTTCCGKREPNRKMTFFYDRRSEESGRPEEFHLQSPSDPCVNLSIHTAPASRSLETSRSQAYAEKPGSSPALAELTIACCELAHPLRSSPITGPSSLIRDDPPPACASILSPFVGFTYRVFS